MFNLEENPRIKKKACVDRRLKDKHQNEGRVLLWRAFKITEKLVFRASKKMNEAMYTFKSEKKIDKLMV